MSTSSITQALARIFHESLAATKDMAVLPGVLGCRPLRRTIQVRLGPIPRYRGTVARWHAHLLRARCASVFAKASTRQAAQSRKRVPSFVVSRQQFMKYPG
ncbi:MAG: hypothetical protein V3W07_01610 [Syntrophobacteria bacterium]